jgi:transcriptional regulator with XRE-family HTH domain
MKRAPNGISRPRRSGSEDIAIGEKIRALRLERGLSQHELGAAVGVTFQQIQKYERGANRVAAGRLRRIADALEVPVTFFYRGTAPAAAHRDAGFGYLKSKKSLRLARAFAQIPSAQARNALVVVVEMIRDKQRSR